MKSIPFAERTHALAESQPEYETLYVHVDKEANGCPFTACFELTEEEIAELVLTKKLWFTQLTFGNLFQPIRMSTSNPFQPAAILASNTEKTTPANEKMPAEVVLAVHEAIAAASRCWERVEDAGVFRSGDAAEVARNLCEVIKKHLNP